MFRAEHQSTRQLPGSARQRGMTLAEVLIAAVLLGFVIASSLTALAQAYGFTQHARMVTLAGQIVESVMEDLRLRNFADIRAYAAQSQPVNFTSTISTEGFNSTFTQTFTLSGTFTTLARPTGANYDRISVLLTVRWTEKNTVYTRKLFTYFGEKGLSDYYYVGWSP